MSDKTIKKNSTEIPDGKIEVNETFGLTNIIDLTISKTRKKYSSKHSVYKIAVCATHPVYGNISFGFEYVPGTRHILNLSNVKDENICLGTSPKGEIKDVVIAAVTEESYAFQLSNKRTTWCHAERDPNQGDYLLWHYLYYGKYSPRSQWRLPARCEKEKLYVTNKCNLCIGQKCDFIKLSCGVCGKLTQRQCPVCLTPICHMHSQCPKGHLNLTDAGMFRGMCRMCGRKTPIEEKACPSCGSTTFSQF
jgi:hypothetical protein